MSIIGNHVLLAIALVALLAVLVPSTANAEQVACSAGGGGYVSTPVTVEVEAVPIVVESTTDDYFVLYVLHDLGGRELRIPVLVALGGNGTTTLSENLPALPKERYHLEKYLVSEPADIDGDCIDDIIELENPVGMSPINRNPVNPNSIDLIDGAMTIPDLETFNALSILHPHTGTSNFKFYIVGLDTADPSIFFFNANTHNYHSSFQNAVNIGNLTNWESLGVFFFDPNATAPDGTSGAYVFRLQPYSAYSFEVIDIAYTMLAASMPLVDNNLAYYVPAADVGYYQYDAASYNESRINVLLEDDFVSDNPFVPLNPAEGYGLLRIMDPDERPGPRDVVLYDAIPNEMPRVAGIITTAPQTPLSHVNLRAIQDGIPNAFIRDALDDDSITDLVGNYVHYTVTSSGWEMTVATQAQVNTHHASSRPAHEQILHADLSVTSITPLSEIRFEDWDAFGIKATNLAVLRTLDFTAGTTPDGFAIPFYFYDQFMKHNGFYDRINTMLVDREFQTDLSTQESELKNLRKAIKKGQTPAWITTALEEMHSQFDNNTSIRYRSSTNNEDLPGFNGAGLYDSKTQHPAETVEDGISKSLKQVYASMWNLRAFAERDFHRVNHTSTMMGVLVHPNYSDELANGVAVSFDPATGSTDTYYVNTQIGEDLVTNPEALSVPEEIKLSKTDIAFGIILHIVPGSPDQSYVEQVYRPKYTVLVTSNHMPPGTLLMSNEQMDQLRKYLSTIHDKFADLYEVESGEQFAMEIEFKITSEDSLAIKQARTWVFGNDTDANSPPTVSAGQDHVVVNGDAVSLEGIATDREGNDLTYQWTSDYSGLTIIGGDTLAPTFTAPEVDFETAIIFTLTVSDGTAEVSDQIIITITDSANTAPTVDAGTDQEITEGSTVTLAGTAADVDQEDNLTYLWSHDSTLSISLDDSTLTPSFTVPNVSEDTAVEFTLTVSDGTAEVSDQIIITITDSANTAPTVDAGADREVLEGSTVTLAGNSTDNDSLTYSWRQTSGLPAVDLQGANTPSPTFTAPAVASDTVFIFEMTVNDGSEILTDTVEITIRDMPDLSYFITTWRTGTAGESITIPVGGATGTYTVDWGDGNTSVNVTGDQTHLYDDAGTYTVHISGDFTRIYLNEDPSNADKLVSIERWGDTRWESMISAFHGASNMVYRATDVPVLSDVTSMRYMFYDAQSFDGDLSGWDVSRVTDMAGTFWGASSFDGDLSGWDVSRVTDMTGTFWGASSFNGDLSGWDVLSVTNMRSMFNGASSFNGDLSGWDVSSVTDMTSMFAGASSFDGDLSGWNVSRVTGMFAMFSAADSFDADLSGWNVSSVTAMSVMFRGASSFDADLSDWDVSSVDAMSVMFMDASSFDADLSDWNVSGVTDMSNMFRGASSFNGDLSDWDVSRVTDMSDMFSGAHSFNADISSWSVSRVTDMYAMFNGAHSFNADISGWDVSRVTDMYAMFYQTNAFDQNLGKWYIVLDDAVIEGDNATGTVGRIAAQNSFLGAQNPSYSIGSGVDSASFEMDGASLRLKAVSDHLTGDSYTINVTSSGGFGTNNFRILEVPVEVSNISPATGTDINQTALAEPAVPLGAPQNLLAVSTDTTVTLTWDSPDDDSITGYKILSRTPATQSQLSVLVDDTGAPGISYVIEGLDPDTVYVFRVIAVNAHGESDSSNFVRLSTDVASTTTDVASTPASAPDAPQNLLAVSTDTTVTLTWDSSDDDSITGYKILSRTPATQSQLSVLVDDTGAPGTSYVIEGLDPDTVYVFRVIAINAHGESDSSNFVRLSTLP